MQVFTRLHIHSHHGEASVFAAELQITRWQGCFTNLLPLSIPGALKDNYICPKKISNCKCPPQTKRLKFNETSPKLALPGQLCICVCVQNSSLFCMLCNPLNSVLSGMTCRVYVYLCVWQCGCVLSFLMEWSQKKFMICWPTSEVHKYITRGLCLSRFCTKSGDRRWVEGKNEWNKTMAGTVLNPTLIFSLQVTLMSAELRIILCYFHILEQPHHVQIQK